MSEASIYQTLRGHLAELLPGCWRRVAEPEMCSCRPRS
jgi:hypothetical protein